MVLLLEAMGYTADRVIIISRHGVRRQFASSAFNFSLYAPGLHFDTSDAAWGVDKERMGVLTQHGYTAVERMGAYQRRRYKSLVPDCKAAFVYCEEDMPRDAKTAEAFFKGLGCDLPPLYTEGVEYLIDQGSHPRGENGSCVLGTQAQVRSSSSSSTQPLSHALASYSLPRRRAYTLTWRARTGTAGRGARRRQRRRVPALILAPHPEAVPVARVLRCQPVWQACGQQLHARGAAVRLGREALVHYLLRTDVRG